MTLVSNPLDFCKSSTGMFTIQNVLSPGAPYKSGRRQMIHSSASCPYLNLYKFFKVFQFTPDYFCRDRLWTGSPIGSPSEAAGCSTRLSEQFFYISPHFQPVEDVFSERAVVEVRWRQQCFFIVSRVEITARGPEEPPVIRNLTETVLLSL